MVVLDPYEISLCDPQTVDQAITFLRQYNPNDFSSDWSAGLEGFQQRYVPYNGMVSTHQLSWLDGVLSKAENSNEKVIVLSHIPTCPGSTEHRTLIWNCFELLDVLHKHNCVVAYLAGHDHRGGFIRDTHGIYHKTFESPLEVDFGDLAFATIHVYDDKLVLDGRGVTKSDVWRF
eukprot:TRINITY_DN6699_c0_g1_i10.p1 TRINITY_DN6699_c0_g1~~TRINITY_DN6699_c0_g1_i10.p1  ORF type:complete len:175 (-),score=30.99 TRINITY_DN6699_c0_g1_i10:55-579(-)